MDQNLEAILSMTIFLLVFGVTNYVCIATYVASIDSKLDYAMNHYAAIVAGAMFINASNSEEGWQSLVPSDDPLIYGIPGSVKLWINTTCISMSASFQPVPVWSRVSSLQPAFRTGECIKMSEIGGGQAIIVTVRAW